MKEVASGRDGGVCGEFAYLMPYEKTGLAFGCDKPEP
jgi:hypothetical protein